MKRMKKAFCALLAMILVVGVCVIPTEAKSGVEQAQDVQNAINNAADGGTVYLSEDVLWGTGEPIVISGKSITIELVNCVIESIEWYPVFLVEEGAELTIDWNGTIKNASLPEGAETEFAEQLAEFGLFEVEKNAKLTLNGGTYDSGYRLIAGKSAGEIVINSATCKTAYQMFDENNTYDITINGGMYNKIPNGNYTIPEFSCWGESMWGDGYELVSAIKVRIPVDDIEMPPVEKTYELPVSVTNRANYAVENVEVQAGYEDCFAEGAVDQRPYYSFEKAEAGEIIAFVMFQEDTGTGIVMWQKPYPRQRPVVRIGQEIQLDLRLHFAGRILTDQPPSAFFRFRDRPPKEILQYRFGS